MTGELTNSTKTISDFIALLPDYDKQKIVDLRQVEDAKPQEVDPVTNQIKDPKRPLVIIVQDWLNSQASGIRKYGGMLQSKPVEKPKCSECGKNHSGKCRSKRDKDDKGVHSSYGDSGSKDKKCPMCKKVMKYKRLGKEYDSTRLHDCTLFMAKSVEERAELLLKHKACPLCTSFTHTKDACNARMKTCNYKENDGTLCGGDHNRAVHGAVHAYVNYVTAKVSTVREEAVVIMAMQTITLPRNVSTTIFYDNGANICMITFWLADKLKLVGKKATLSLVTATNTRKLKPTKIYNYTLTDNYGARHKIQFYGVERITSRPRPADVSGLYELFPFAEPGSLERPDDDVGMLIGVNEMQLMPYGGDPVNGERVGRMSCLRTSLGSGYVLAGKSDMIKDAECNLSQEYHDLTSVHHIEIEEEGDAMVNHIQVADCHTTFLEDQINKETGYFFDDMGVQQPVTCLKCSGCQHCKDMNGEMSRVDKEVYDKVRASMKINEAEGNITVEYPFNANYDKLINNMNQAIKLQTSVERGLWTKGRMDEYNKELEKIFLRGALVEVTLEQIQAWVEMGGKVNFIGHHPVYKDSSLSTPLRIVSNAALRNGYRGPSLNDCLYKGPQCLSNLLRVLLRWRTYIKACVFDLTKAYNTILTGDKEMFTRLQVWRWGDKSKRWTIFAYRTVAFGDLTAALILEIAKQMCCEEAELKGYDPAVIAKILRDMYVDDALTGAMTDEELDKMIGNMTVKEDGSLNYDGELSKILKIAGFKPKTIVRSGTNPKEALDKLGAVMGHDWLPLQDSLQFKFSFKVKEGRSKTLTKTLTKDNVNDVELTKRTCLGLSSQTFDPLGLCCPVLIKMKICMKDIVLSKILWDQVIPDELIPVWRTMLHDLLDMPPITFPRSVCPEGCEPVPELIGYHDGSQSAYSCCIYLRWKVKGEERWISFLFIAKSRITQLGLSIPRSELNSLLILARLVSECVQAMPVQPARITLIGDSQCTISCMEARNAVLNVYCANRVQEIERLLRQSADKAPDTVNAKVELDTALLQTPPTKPMLDLLQHTPGPDNIADLATRGEAHWSEIAEGSTWQTGPTYLTGPRDHWPISRDFVQSIPKEESRAKLFKFVNATIADHSPSTDTDKTQSLTQMIDDAGDYNVLKGSLARLIKVTFDKGTHKPELTIKERLAITPDPLAYKLAEMTMYNLSMGPTMSMIEKGKLESLNPFIENNIAYTRGRLGDSIETVLGQPKLPIICGTTKLARLILQKCHEEDHRADPSDTLYRSRKYAWIVSGKNTAKSVVKDCPYCKLQSKKLCTQRMGDLPPEITNVPCPPFTNVCVDYTAPMVVRAMTNKRARMKCFPIVFCCMNTGSLHMELAASYSTADFLLCYRNFCSIRGVPMTVYTDAGSNLVAAQTVVQGSTSTVTKDIDWSQVTAITAPDGTVWRIAPAGAQHRNGRAERCVAALKKTLRHMLNGQELNFAELQCLLNMAASVINDRPLAVSHHNGEEPSYAPITPNLLLKGSRSATSLNSRHLYTDTDTKFAVRMAMVDKVYNAWWSRWFATVFDHLLPYPRWNKANVNLDVGDICLLKFNNKMDAGDYRLCRVSKVYPDAQGLVRTVDIQYRVRDPREKSLPYKSKSLLTTKVPVQRLVLLYSMVEEDRIRAKVAHIDATCSHCCGD